MQHLAEGLNGLNGLNGLHNGIEDPIVPLPRKEKTILCDETPGIFFDEDHRIFRLQTRSTTYAFRVDDDKNLEHLYWGPSIPHADDLLYLTKSHVAGPFDPVGSVAPTSVAKLLGLDELSDGASLAEKWKVFTKQKDTEDANARGRRLENASWRLWNMEKAAGGDLNVDVSEGKLAESLYMEPPNTNDDDTPGSLPKDTFMPVPTDKNEGNVVVSGKNHATEHFERQHESGTRMLPVRSVGNLARLNNLAGTPSGSETPRSPRPYSPGNALLEMDDFPRLSSAGDFNRLKESQWQKLDSQLVGKNTKLLEWADSGTGDYREPSFKVRFHKDGSSICPLEYKGYKIVHRKLNMPASSLPTVYTESPTEATTLVVEMWDKISQVKFQLFYTVMHDYDTIIRRSAVFNEGSHPVTLEHISSGMVDFDAEHEYYVSQLSGGWARERQQITKKLEDGVNMVKSIRGTSSHQFNPFVVVSPDRVPEEDDGECFGFCLVYSGNFAITADVSEYKRLRVNVGINPENFSWRLDGRNGENSAFYSPEVLMSYSNEGLGGMSRDLHRLMRERLIPSQWRYKVPPVLLNTWEAVYFDFTHEIIVQIARQAATAGVELLVLDDGWFGNRNDTFTSLGDWTPNKEKLPYGLDGLAKAVNGFGMSFGIWVEPEMVSMESDLFRRKPEWCLCVPRRLRTTGRNQLVLDFSRQEVVDYIYEQLHKLLTSANIEYVKWDMNRHLTEVFSEAIVAERQGEVSHRFILGVYSVFKRITEAFPKVRFESCSGGGGRYDAGMLAYAPQIWTSDNTDAISRMTIQYGTSLAYPLCTMGAHVSAVPNHQTGRSATMKTRSLLAMCGTYGYELDPRKWTAEMVDEIKGYIAMFKRLSPLVYEGDLYRLWSPFTSKSMAWMVVSRDKLHALVFAFKVSREVGRLEPRLRLRGLRPEVLYSVEELCPGTFAFNPANGAIINDPRGVYQIGARIDVTGKTLEMAGLPVKFMFDGDSVCYEINAVDNDNNKIFEPPQE